VKIFILEDDDGYIIEMLTTDAVESLPKGKLYKEVHALPVLGGTTKLKYVDGQFIDSGVSRTPLFFGDYRLKDYPSVGDQLEAIWAALETLPGKDLPPTTLDVLAKIRAVKKRYPKPVEKE
jgi:hypothetical protein